MTTRPVTDALLAMDASRVPPIDSALEAIAAYAERAIAEDAETWPPYIRAAAYRNALLNIVRECRAPATNGRTP